MYLLAIVIYVTAKVVRNRQGVDLSLINKEIRSNKRLCWPRANTVPNRDHLDGEQTLASPGTSTVSSPSGQLV